MARVFLEARVLSRIKVKDIQKESLLKERDRDPILAPRYQHWCVDSVIYMAIMKLIAVKSTRFKTQILTNKLGVNLTLGSSY